MSMLGTQEHYDLIAQFDRQFKGHRLDKEDKLLWRLGRVYQDGHVDNLYNAFISGYALGKAVELSAAGNENARLVADLLAVLTELRECADYWSEYFVPLGIVERMDAVIAKATGQADQGSDTK